MKPNPPKSAAKAGPASGDHGKDRGSDNGKGGHRKSGPGKPWRKEAHRPNAGHHHASPTAEAADDGHVVLYGIHAVTAALANPARRISKILLTENAENRLADAIAQRQIPVERVRPKDLDRLLGADTVHQGVMAHSEALDEPELSDFIAAAEKTGAPLVVLDQVTDPHNVGAVLRSAAVFGASGLITTRRHSPPLNGTLAKAASGALELVPVALVQNLARTLAELKQAGVTVIGLDGEGDMLIDDHPMQGAVAFVLGAEGKGLRQLTRETCNAVCRIGTSDALASLNVSNAAAIALHLSAMRRRATNS